MLAVLAAALFSTIALLATALFALLAQLNGFRAEVTGRFDTVTSDIGELKAGLARVEQKLDGHLASPHPAG